ncbi:Crp/Fnr family transcriptional regulator [Gemmiger formicilis]|uniref:Crp/Fnr family transcriptional regulator n=1 Tax=Gemmiger formicilis TaxID=745368 RepID=UPI00195A632D|nr:Crp/Fnr family transcriptional regulator [Gemmiger formicilis]MBM6898897.1 Crp/Fnr family transcriptional regulator [Gemmiger formicilis]
MEFAQYFPVWDKLTPAWQRDLAAAAVLRKVPAGTLLHNGSADCIGFLLVRTGQLRAYILSDEGREITLYRLFARDMCLLSASCILRGLQYDVAIQAEKDTELWQIPAQRYKQLMEESAPVANYTNEVMATRFSDVMWLMEQILWKSFDKRLAAFLLEESALEGGTVLKTTHEIIGHHLGSPREVVTRMLRYFQEEGLVRLSRGTVELLDPARLQTLAEG